MMRNIKNIALVLAILSAILGCSDQWPQKTYTIGIINLNKNLNIVISEFKKSLTQYGHNAGVNITYIDNGTLNSQEQVDQEVLNMMNAGVDLLFTLTTPVTKRAVKITKDSDLSILFAPVFSPVSAGIVKSIAKPGKNVTGIKTDGSTGKAFEWLLKTVPTAEKIFIPFHKTDPAAKQTVQDLKEAAKFFNKQLIIKELYSAEELDKILSEIPVDVDAVWLTHSHLIISNTEKIVAAATAQKIPVISSADQSRKGVMLCYAPSHAMIGRQASRLAKKILNGASPATLPIETADFFLSLNLKTANTIGITIPDEIISQADFVIR